MSNARVLDNFDDNTKTDWQDFTFIGGFGIPTEANGQFQFLQPAVGQSIFSASRKVSEEFELKNGRTIEFKVDLVHGEGKDSFAVLAFIPTANSLGSLAGYGLAKSTTDILLTKGIGKYFFADNPSTPIKNDNVTLVLTLTAKDGSVTIHGKVLDKDNANAVIWEQTVVDSPDADVLVSGTDDPAAPYLTRGQFALYLYQDDGRTQPFYQVIYDNAQVCVLDDVVLDNFDDNTKTDWQDFTFIGGFGIPTEAGGQFQFIQPAVGQSIFSASRKTSRAFDLRECEHLQFRVDLVHGEGKDSFAVLAFIPEANSLGTLAGYGLAKSTTDILLTKGIGKYFFADNPSTPIKNDNVTLVLDLTVANSTTVVIKGQVLDKDNNNAVIWEYTVVDSPDADVLISGTDDPPAPYLTSGNFALYLYQDDGRTQPFYQVIYDNAAVLAPALAANQPPKITDITPADTANFLPASTQITFTASDDKALVNTKISVTVNGSNTFTTANGLVVTGTGNSRSVSLGGFQADSDYTAVLQVVDSDNATNSAVVHFDTFDPANTVIEIEDYNFNQGGFWDGPVPIPQGQGPQDFSYSQQVGVRDIDFTDTRASANGTDTKYRTGDPIRMQHTFDIARQKFIDAGGSGANVFDYDVGDIVGGEWMNYTRTFTPGSYLVYLRQSLVNISQAECGLEKVTGDTFFPDQTTVPLGSFLGKKTGFQYGNVPLTDALGNPVIVRLADIETLRLRQVTTEPGDALISQNYLILVPTADPGLQRARVVSVTPADGSTTTSVEPTVSATIQNFDTAVISDSIELWINGAKVSGLVTSNETSSTVEFALSPLPPSGSTVSARVIFTDDFTVKQTNGWSFVLGYKSLNPANRVQGVPLARGFNVRMVQAVSPSDLDNSLARAEDQLAIPSPYAAFMDTNTIMQTVNMDKRIGESAGFVGDDDLVPGLFDANNVSFGNGDSDFTVESVAYLDLAAGVYRFGAVTDDGYKCSSGAQLHDASAGAVLGFHNGGPANETFEFVVREPGLYPFRFLWYERGGAGYGELTVVNRTTGARILVNAPNNPDAINAYTGILSIKLQSSADVTGPYTDDGTASLDAGNSTFTVPAGIANRFFRIKSNAPYKIDSIAINGGNVEIKYVPAP